jgi:hypothetical protein
MKTKCSYCGHGEYELRGPLAVLIVLLTFGLAYVQVLKGASETLIPPWAGVILGSVVTFYFMSRSAERMRTMTQESQRREETASQPPP